MNTTEVKAYRRHSTNGTDWPKGDIFGAFQLSSSIARYIDGVTCTHHIDIVNIGVFGIRQFHNQVIYQFV